MCILAWAACRPTRPPIGSSTPSCGRYTPEQAEQAEHFYYNTIATYPKPDLDLFLLCYLCGSVVLSSFLQAWVRPETRPLLCQWNGRQEQGWCAKPDTWLPEEITWQKLKHQTCRNVCFEIPETWLSLWFFGMLWFSHVGWKQSVTLQGHWEYYPLCSHGICEAN